MIFSDGNVRQYIDTALATVPADKHGALVAYADNGAARMVLAARVGEHWTFAAHVDREPDDLTYGAAVRFTW